MKRAGSWWVVFGAVVALGGCGSGGEKASGPKIQESGQAAQNLNEVTTTTVAGGGTIPLDDEKGPAVMRLGDTFGNFQACLKREGYGDADLTDVQARFDSLEQGLKDALAKCNNETGMSQIFEEMQKENENLTPEQVKMRNIGYIAFRECAIKRGWTWPEAVPDKNGLLGFGGGGSGGGGGGGFKPPAGEDISKLMDACMGDAAKAVKDAGGEDILAGG